MSYINGIFENARQNPAIRGFVQYWHPDSHLLIYSEVRANVVCDAIFTRTGKDDIKIRRNRCRFNKGNMLTQVAVTLNNMVT